MRTVEKHLRVFGAGFQRPVFGNWVRTRAGELKRLREPFTVLVIWGALHFTVSHLPKSSAVRLPRGEPTFAIRRQDGTIERSPWSMRIK